MRAIQFNEIGGPEVLHLVDADEPHAGPGRCGLPSSSRRQSFGPDENSCRYLEGQAIALPSGVGSRIRVVDEVGEGVADLSIGDAIFGCGFDMVAQYAVLRPGSGPQARRSAVRRGAGFSVVVETATRILAQVGVKAGETLL